MSKLPAMQFYIGDWRKDPGVQALAYHDRGIWFEILCLMFESEERGVLLLNGRPMPGEALAQVLGLDKQTLTTVLTTILEFGVASRRESDGAIFSRRMVRDERLRKVRAEAGKLGGNPALLNQKQTTQDKEKTTPSSSFSASSSKLRKARLLSPEQAAFDAFWSEYPRKVNRQAAAHAWAKLSPDSALVETIMAALKIQRASEQWRKDGGKYVPHAATWINGRRWEDEIQAPKQGDPGLGNPNSGREPGL